MEPIIVVPGSIEQQRGYRVGAWGKFPNYECLRCAYSTLFERRMAAHIAEGKHPWGFPGRGTDALCDGRDPEGAKPEQPTKLVY